MNRVLGFVYAACAIAFVLWAAGCGPVLNAQTLPPPGRTAAFEENDGHYDLALSQGVAIAISCDHGGPCKDVVVSTGDERIADVKGASIGANTLAAGIVERGPGIRYTTATTSGFVIVGKHPGTTRIRVKTADGSKTIRVEVLPPPATGAPATRATATTSDPAAVARP